MVKVKNVTKSAPVEEKKAPEPVVEKAPEPVVEKAPEPVVEKAPEPVVEEKAPEPVVEKKAPEPVVEKKAPEPVVEKKAPEPVTNSFPDIDKNMIVWMKKVLRSEGNSNKDRAYANLMDQLLQLLSTLNGVTDIVSDLKKARKSGNTSYAESFDRLAGLCDGFSHDGKIRDRMDAFLQFLQDK